MQSSIKTVFKTVRPEKSLTTDASNCINDYIETFLSQLLNKQHLSLFSIKDEMEKLVHPLIIPHIEKEMKIVFNKYYKDGVTNKHVDFSINSLKKWMKTADIKTFCFTDLLYIALCVEYLCSEICELSGKVANKNGKIRVTCEHINEAIETDKALSHTFKIKQSKKSKRKSRD
jgi:hypothetical protein